uniref:ExeM/NucH family extracellular endonuclease n=1 Tax=uncultured Arthrobacter sp. TaxID=114050 RepID=UPI0032169667
MKHIPWKTALGTALSVGLIAAPLAAVPAFAVEVSPAAGTSPVIINEAYLSGGSAGAAYKNKFVELYNTSDAPVSLDGWSLQYRSATGLAAPSFTAPLTGSIPAKGYYLLKGGANGGTAPVGAELPAADVTAAGFNPAGGGGTIVLAKQSTAINPLATGSVIESSNVADLLGYGTSNTFETQAATAPKDNNDVKSLNRSNGVDSNSNAADFTLNATITPTAAGGVTPPVDPPADPGPVTPPATKTIAEIQGNGTASPLVGTSVTTRGKVTATFPTGGFAGYYIQTPGTGGDLTPANHTASEAIFVFSSATAGSVQAGDYVEVTGAVSEYFGMTQVTVTAGADLKKLTEAAPEVKATGFALPAEEAFRESLEGMLLAPQGPVTVSDNYSLNQYGEIGLAGGTTPLEQPTAVAEYGSATYTATVAANAARGIKLDDGATTNFLKDATTKALELPYLTTADPVRVGAPVSFKTNVVLSYANGSWKFQPLTHLTPANAEAVQPVSFGATTRTDAPAAVGGNLKIASFNVLNYFPTTGDQLTGCTYYTDRAGNPITVRGGCDARGAANAANLQRQQDKIVAAITKSGADVVSLMEIENSAQFGKNRDDALAKLVDALNIATPGIWDYVRTPANAPPLADEDMIRTAFIFKRAAAEPVGESVIHNDTV